MTLDEHVSRVLDVAYAREMLDITTVMSATSTVLDRHFPGSELQIDISPLGAQVQIFTGARVLRPDMLDRTEVMLAMRAGERRLTPRWLHVVFGDLRVPTGALGAQWTIPAHALRSGLESAQIPFGEWLGSYRAAEHDIKELSERLGLIEARERDELHRQVIRCLVEEGRQIVWPVTVAWDEERATYVVDGPLDDAARIRRSLSQIRLSRETAKAFGDDSARGRWRLLHGAIGPLRGGLRLTADGLQKI